MKDTMVVKKYNFVRQADITQVGYVSVNGANLEELEDNLRMGNFETYLVTDQDFDEEEWTFAPCEETVND